MYNLKKPTLKYKSENTTTYQFTNEYKETDVIIINKQKSGYEVELRQCNGNFKRIDGLSTIKQIQKQLNKWT